MYRPYEMLLIIILCLNRYSLSFRQKYAKNVVCIGNVCVRCPASPHETIACRSYNTDTTNQHGIDASDTDPQDPVQ